jgi:cathepsin L
MTVVSLFGIVLIASCLFQQSESLSRFHSSIDTALDGSWEEFKSLHGKSYNQHSEFYRRLIWEDNLRKVRQHNLEYDLGRHSYSLGINAMSDMSDEEFRKFYLPGLGDKKDKNSNNTAIFMPPLNVGKVPDSVDWRNEGYVTPVKNQGQCGSCWSFSTTGALEGQYFRKAKQLVSFSEQQLVDCSQAFGPEGCNGGWPDDAFAYIAKSGIESEEDYPYTAKDGVCRYTASRVVTKDKGCTAIPAEDEEALKQAVANVGPISVCIDAGQNSFRQYRDGVYDEPECTTELDHAVLIVGYGTWSDGKDYWLVKNSWGTSWGKNGYILMRRNQNNQCGIASHARYPIL